MSEPYLGEIQMFGGTFAPVGWAFCDGRLLSISQASALFSLLGTMYGGNGETNFALPDLRGRVPIHKGTGANLDGTLLTNRVMGESGGMETEVLSADELPDHGHTLRGSGDAATSSDPAGRVPAKASVRAYHNDAPDMDFHESAIVGDGGNSTPHNNMMPFTVVTFIIALTGNFPSQS
ncbi:MAG: tail fiber protein [Pseudomonadota bacterium]